MYANVFVSMLFYLYYSGRCICSIYVIVFIVSVSLYLLYINNCIYSIHVFIFIVSMSLYMGICLEKCHFGFSKSSIFKRVVLLVLMPFYVYLQVAGLPGFARDSKLLLFFGRYDISHNVGPTQNYKPSGQLKWEHWNSDPVS